jgi:hypothetical protein
MLRILANLGDDYELVQFQNPLTLEELHHELNNRYHKIKYKYSQNTDNPSNTPRPQGQERALYAGNKLKELAGNVERLDIKQTTVAQVAIDHKIITIM